MSALFVIAAYLGVVLVFDWLVWLVWCWVLPQVWTTGPQNIVSPDFWLFVAVMFLVGIVGRVLFGGSKS